MAQNAQVSQSIPRYTRADFTALRARLSKIAPAQIARLYYTDDDLVERRISSLEQLDAWLTDMRNHLSERASNANPQVAQILADARKANRWSRAVIEHLVQAADTTSSLPSPGDALTAWLKPRVGAALKSEGLVSIADLLRWMERRGATWWRPIPRIGERKAQAIERWLRANEASLGLLRMEDALPAVVNRVDIAAVGPGNRLVPLERIQVGNPLLDGSQGRNRNQSFCLITAKNDLEAIRAYLYRFREKEKTARAYQKELERFLLWCVKIRHIPMSSVLTEECEAYKDFLANPDATWVGPKAPRASDRWRPFAKWLNLESQRYAVQALRSFFEWLVRVRYLGGNPWITVKDPAVPKKEVVLDIDKALPATLWNAVAAQGGLLDRVCSDAQTQAAFDSADRPADGWRHQPSQYLKQYRLARAAILLMGYSGMRREEAAFALRGKLKPVGEVAADLWELTVLGKGNKIRTVFFPARVVDALRAHWCDRGHDFDDPAHEEASLISPVAIPFTQASRAKHLTDEGDLSGNGFSPDGLYRVVKQALKRMAKDPDAQLDPYERHLLDRAAPHALRHTFATHAVAGDMPIDVLQRLMGHASQNTTSHYVRAERARSIEEVGKLYSKKTGP